MKSLLLFRHGKSDWEGTSLSDHDRPVSDRGVRAARTMGRFLSLAGQAPDSVVTSSAIRAKTSAELAIEAGSWKCTVRVTRALYEATPFQVLEEVRTENVKTATLLLAGHEPTWSELASLLVGGGSLEFPTACLARMDFDVEDWKEIEYGKGVLVWLLPPKLFTKGEFAFVK